MIYTWEFASRYPDKDTGKYLEGISLEDQATMFPIGEVVSDPYELEVKDDDNSLVTKTFIDVKSECTKILYRVLYDQQYLINEFE